MAQSKRFTCINKLNKCLITAFSDKLLEGGKKALVNDSNYGNMYKVEIDMLQKIIRKHAMELY